MLIYISMLWDFYSESFKIIIFSCELTPVNHYCQNMPYASASLILAIVVLPFNYSYKVVTLWSQLAVVNSSRVISLHRPLFSVSLTYGPLTAVLFPLHCYFFHWCVYTRRIFRCLFSNILRLIFIMSTYITPPEIHL